MAEGQDKSQKTEDPTERKLSEAHKKGEVAKSTEVTALFSLITATLVFAFYAGGMSTKLRITLSRFFELAHTRSFEAVDMTALYKEVIGIILFATLIPLCLILTGGILGNLVQHKPVWTAERMKPKVSKISPKAGLKRLFGAPSLVNFLKSIAKLVLVAAIVVAIMWPERDMLALVSTVEPSLILPIVQDLGLQILIAVIGVLTIIAILDFSFQKYNFMTQQRMTKQEVKDEFKQSDGDPKIKAKLAQIRAERSRTRMMAAVPEATVVIMNPTHYAVALKYDTDDMQAPICVAKGIDEVALRIRDTAEDNDVAVVENPPLARALFASVELDEEIPADHFKAVAEIIGYVMRLNKRGWK
jgi:flagellar biosynthesis protein FlhB